MLNLHLLITFLNLWNEAIFRLSEELKKDKGDNQYYQDC